MSTQFSGSGSLTLPDPMIGDSIEVVTGVTLHQMLDRSFRTIAKLPVFKYVWTYNVNKCFPISSVQAFFNANRGRELIIVPWFSSDAGDVFSGYFLNNNLPIASLNNGYQFTLEIVRRIAATGDIR